MSIILFIIILALLILSHEFGHFIVAKKFGIRVDEFGFGFPPKLFSVKKGETEYSFNALPFGGFVRIFGERPDDESISGPDSARSFINKPKRVQAAVLLAGVFFNILLAWFLLSIGFVVGLPSSLDGEPRGARITSPALMITSVLPDSPAEAAGLEIGDKVLSLSALEEELIGPTPEEVQGFISRYPAEEITVFYERGKEKGSVVVVPREGVLEEKPAVGIAMDMIGILRLPVHLAVIEGAKATVSMTGATAVALTLFLKDAILGQADFAAIAGPVGIVNIAGDAFKMGFVYLLLFTALISINLAIINLIPFPALDGGRLLFLLIEKIKGSPIRPKIANVLNTVGFLLLIFLILLVTYHDIVKLI